MSLKTQQDVENEKEGTGRPGRGNQVNVTNLDARYDPNSEEEGANLGEFMQVKLGDDPFKVIWIEASLPKQVKEKLTRCLKEHADLFAWSATNMPEIHLEVACVQSGSGSTK